MVVDGPLSWSLACLGLKHHNTEPPIGANKFMDNAFEEALSLNHVAEALLPERRSREAGFYASIQYTQMKYTWVSQMRIIKLI